MRSVGGRKDCLDGFFHSISLVFMFLVVFSFNDSQLGLFPDFSSLFYLFLFFPPSLSLLNADGKGECFPPAYLNLWLSLTEKQSHLLQLPKPSNHQERGEEGAAEGRKSFV